MQHNADPKNYYKILGVSPDADETAIKSAFRTKAMQYHPDRNASPEAEVQFRRINEAYGIVGDPEQRRRYHAKAAKVAKDRSKPKTSNTETHQPKRPTAEPPKQTREAASNTRSTGAQQHTSSVVRPHFHVCKSCGTLSAQPRILVFGEVSGRPFAPEKKTISGVYCPRCAANVAVQASLHTWVHGMLAIPKGPFWSLKALWQNLWGGEQPREANARMLLSQARAFLGKGDVDLARATIAQATSFAEKTAYQHEVETLLMSLNNSSQKSLKSRWPLFGRALWLQAAPFVAVFAIIAGAMTVSVSREAFLPTKSGPVLAEEKSSGVKKEKTKKVAPSLVQLPSGSNTPLPTYKTARDMVPLRGAPSGQSKAIDFIPKGNIVTMIAIVPQKKWVQVRLSSGKTGFMHLDDLK